MVKIMEFQKFKDIKIKDKRSIYQINISKQRLWVIIFMSVNLMVNPDMAIAQERLLLK
jgi:hypothetical protein